MLWSVIVSINVLCLCLPWVGLLMYCFPSPACVFQVVSDVGGEGGGLELWRCSVALRILVMFRDGCRSDVGVGPVCLGCNCG